MNAMILLELIVVGLRMTWYGVKESIIRKKILISMVHEEADISYGESRFFSKSEEKGVYPFQILSCSS